MFFTSLQKAMFTIKKLYIWLALISAFSILKVFYSARNLVTEEKQHLVVPSGVESPIINSAHPIFSLEYESERRTIQRAMFEKWRTFKEEMEKIRKSHVSMLNSSVLQEILQIQEEHQAENLAIQELLRESDSFDDKRAALHRETSHLVQQKIHASQNPECNSAKLLICEGKANTRNKPICGWGCMMHHALRCFQAAFCSKRVLVLDEELFALSMYFQPLSENFSFSAADSKKNVPEWPGKQTDKVVKMSQLVNNVKLSQQEMECFSPYLPKDLTEKLQLISPDPEYWYIGQFIVYLLRPKAEHTRFIESLSKPYEVAVHIRRSDKILEAYFFDIQEYMKVVEEYFSRLQYKNLKPSKEVYLATDDSTAVDEAFELFGLNYTVHANYTAADNASEILNRYLEPVQEALLKDFLAMANSDFLVCTFSSNLCRLAYEYKLATKHLFPDLHKVVSLDLNPFGDFERQYIANHDRFFNRAGELTFKRGDRIFVVKSKKKNEMMPKRDFGTVKSIKGDPQHFIRSSVAKVFRSSSSVDFL